MKFKIIDTRGCDKKWFFNLLKLWAWVIISNLVVYALFKLGVITF